MIVNRLVDNYFTLKSFGAVGGWRNGYSTILSDGGITELTPTLGCRQLQLTGGVENTIYIDSLEGDSSFYNSPALFVFAIKIPNGASIEIQFEDTSIVETPQSLSFTVNSSSPSINAVGVASPQWSIVRAITAPFTSPTPAIKITIIITKNQDEPIYFTSPVLTPQFEVLNKNGALREWILPSLPEFMLEDDFATVTPIDIPLTRFIDIATLEIDNVFKQTASMAYLDTFLGRDETDNDTLSSLVDTQVATADNLTWLCKFIGTKPVTRFTSSEEIPTEPFILDSSELDSADTLRITSYSSLNPPALDYEAQRDLLAWQVYTRAYGFSAGTNNALIEAAKLMLVGDQTVSLSYDYVTTPFEIEIQTPWYETLGADETQIGESSHLVIEAIQRAKPIGVLVTHVMTA